MSRLPTKEARARNRMMKALYAENILTAAEIARRFGVTPDWVRSVVAHVERIERTRGARNRLREKRGLPMLGSRTRERLVKPHTAKAAQLYASGAGSYGTIAKKLRISRNAVAGAVHRAKGLS